MGIGLSIVLLALGAILIWAVDASVAGVDVTAIGWIFLIAGATGGLLSLMFASPSTVRGRSDNERIARTH